MENTHRALEAIKNTLIVVLTLSAVLLLCLYRGNLDFGTLFTKPETIDVPVQTADAPKTREIILPAEICVNFASQKGGACATLLPEDYSSWNTLTGAFGNLSRSDGAKLEEITETTYRALLAAKSVRFSFAYGLPFDGFCKQFGIASAPFSAIGHLSEIVFSEASSSGLFIWDGVAKKYYRLVGADDDALSSVRSLIEEASIGKTVFSYPVTSVLGEENSALLPETLSSEERRATVEKEFHAENRDDEADKFAMPFFDNSLAFVRRVEDSKGTLTYLYGYSQKVLTVSVNGIAEYKEELEPATVTQGFYASLGTALSFVAEHGGWYPDVTMNGKPLEGGLTPFLWNAEPIESYHRNGFRYTFGFRAGEDTLYCDEETAIAVEVFDGQVTYYRRAMFISVALETEKSGEEVCSPANAIAGNSEWIYDVLSKNGVLRQGADEEERFGLVARAIVRAKSGFLLTSAADEDYYTALPVWAVRAGRVLLYFDLHTGEPVSFGAGAQ